ncbi:hypothetical protein HMI01_22090 [Halolactibacillus miurensis]|uniref:Uncharacterized protein n=1 Tax=Halolactibacillus miurensis TaxID=306541 RepID=A0A1I6UEP3_9BACI|nr:MULTISPECIES: hypothetical protein [Halolactibacillus]GEM05221.1 hypothetical protein HMI01_22090 [Halolactibacillus miurensis]SFS99881.1 hypothetical protein SAMN05421668_12538 [Halolactibacillus miurensis]
MKELQFEHLSFYYHDAMNVLTNSENKTVIFVNKDYDEIHGVVEIKANETFKIFPRYNVNFLIDQYEITVSANYVDSE